MNPFDFNKIIITGSDPRAYCSYAKQLSHHRHDYELILTYDTLLDLNRAISIPGKRIIVMKEIELCCRVRQPNSVILWVYGGIHDARRRKLFVDRKHEMTSPTHIILFDLFKDRVITFNHSIGSSNQDVISSVV